MKLQQMMDELHEAMKQDLDERSADEAARDFGLTPREREAYLRSIRVSV